MKWTLFDYGVGNIHSLRKALMQHVDVHLERDPRRLADAEAIVLPGVGAFGPVMAALAPGADAVRAHHAAGKPLLGVCIGMQVLYGASAEAPGVPGLGILGEEVVRLPEGSGKVPHMGWNTIDALPRRRDGSKSLDSALAAAGHVYYVHSYAAPVGPATLAATEYGMRFAAAVRTGSAIGFQFHAEKSSTAGKAILGAALRSLEAA